MTETNVSSPCDSGVKVAVTVKLKTRAKPELLPTVAKMLASVCAEGGYLEIPGAV